MNIRIPLILLMLCSTLMTAQQFTFDFSNVTTDNWIADQGVGSVSTTSASPAIDGAVGVVSSSSTGQDWQNAQIVLQTGDYKLDLSGNDKTLSFDYYSNETGGGMIKLEGNGATAVEVYFSYDVVNTWVPITITFSAADGQYEKIIYFPHYGSSLAYDGVNMPKNDTKISYFDNFFGVRGDEIVPLANAPTVAAPTPPSRAANDVISLFSDTYQNISLSEFPASWSQGAHNINYDINGNKAIFADNSEFIGIVSNYGSGTNLSTMEYMHIDYYTTASTEIFVKLVNTIDGGDALTTLGTTVMGEWKSVDIPMSNFGSLNLGAITQFLIDPATAMDVYYDNIYFWKAPSAYDKTLSDLTIDGTTITGFASGLNAFTVNMLDNSTVVPVVGATKNDANVTMTITQASSLPGQASILLTDPNNETQTITVDFKLNIPTAGAPEPPTRNPTNVISIFSDVYTGQAEPLSEFPTSWSQGTHNVAYDIDGNTVIFADNSEFIGIVSNYGSGTDLSDMEFMHLDYYATSDTGISVKLVNTIASSEDIVSLGTITEGSWQSVDIALSEFNADLSSVTQFLIDPASATDVYYDNFYFWRNSGLGNDTKEKTALRLYPNPVQDELFIDSAVALESVTVYNMLGKQMLHKTVNKKRINVSALPTGIYSIQIKVNGKILAKKFIKH